VGFRRGRIEVKSRDQLAAMRSAGLVVAEALRVVAEAVAPGITTASLDDLAAQVIGDHGARPSFLGYHGFPATICVSVNEQIVHGIPGPQVIGEGDLVSIDCGAIVDGWHGDAAVSVAVAPTAPELALLSRVTEASLWAGIRAVEVGARVGDVGYAVEAAIAAAVAEHGQPFDIVDGYTGHGIGSAMHMAPDVPNFGERGRGPRLVEGMAIAIEPMITLGSAETSVLADDWTVVSTEGSPAAHWEHTVAVTSVGPWVLTAEDGGGLLRGDPLA
jgi:methionyl aminopeptidase